MNKSPLYNITMQYHCMGKEELQTACFTGVNPEWHSQVNNGLLISLEANLSVAINDKFVSYESLEVYGCQDNVGNYFNLSNNDSAHARVYFSPNFLGRRKITFCRASGDRWSAILPVYYYRHKDIVYCAVPLGKQFSSLYGIGYHALLNTSLEIRGRNYVPDYINHRFTLKYNSISLRKFAITRVTNQTPIPSLEQDGNWWMAWEMLADCAPWFKSKKYKAELRGANGAAHILVEPCEGSPELFHIASSAGKVLDRSAFDYHLYVDKLGIFGRAVKPVYCGKNYNGQEVWGLKLLQEKVDG